MEELYKTYYDELVEFGLRFIANKHAVQDIVMETLWRVHTRNYHDNLRGRLFYSVRNACLNHIKKWKIRKRIEREHFTQDEYDLVETQTEALLLIYKMIDQLPRKTQAVIKLAVKDGLTNEEICAVLNKKMSVVTSLKHYAIITLRKKIKEQICK